jgi:outer membrane protein insertion porin family
MNGVPIDTREPGTTQPIQRALSSCWWGTALALSGLMCCILLPLEWQVTAFAQTKDGSPRPTRPRRVPITPDDDLKPKEPWQSLLEPDVENNNTIVDILVEGNISIPDSSILRLVKTRKGRAATPKAVREDVKALFETRWFTGVTPVYRNTSEGTVLIFRVIEAPILDAVTYIGNKKIKTRVLEGVTGLRKGGPFSTQLNTEAARGIERYYLDKGYHFCKVTLKKGGAENDREAIFEIDEGPKTFVKSTRFVGNQFFTPGELRLHLKTGVRYVSFIPIGGTYNPSDMDDDVAGLREYYQKVGFLEAKITAEREFSPDKKSIAMTYTIDEGTRFKVGKIYVKGTEVISEETLRKDFKLAENDFFNSDKLTRDVDEMTNKYGNLGRLFAEVNATPIFLPEQPGIVDIVYRINEDKVYRVRRVDVVMHGGTSGNASHTKDTVVLNQMLVAPGDLANKALIKKSERRIASSSFFANAQSGSPPKIDIRKVNDMHQRPSSEMARAQGWSKEEDEEPVQETVRAVKKDYVLPQFEQGPVEVPDFGPDGYPIVRTKAAASRNATAPVSQGSSSQRSPRGVANLNQEETVYNRSATRGQSSAAAYPRTRTANRNAEDLDQETLPQELREVTRPRIQRTNFETPKSKPMTPKPGRTSFDLPMSETPKSQPPQYDSSQSTLDRSGFLDELFNGGESTDERLAAGGENDLALTNLDDWKILEKNGGRTGTLIRAQGPGLEGAPAQNPLFNNSPQGNPYGNPMLSPSPDQPGWVDLVPEVTETQTGRISFGIGLNSDAGFLGNAIIDESNFDITRVPASFADILNGTAFRGGGQQFRVEAVPGTQVSRYMASWRDPFFLDTNNSLGVSGFYYTRLFQDWMETRAGGNIKVGRQFDNYTSGVFTLRLEDVELSGAAHNPPPLLADSLGHSLLSTARVGLIHDTRDSAFLPTEGHYLEGGYEQAFGEFHYPRFDAIARRYFTTYQRADGEGRHILAFNGQVSYTGSDTPIYERLYAGGFSSFRGFQFRGVTPRDNGVGVGGQWLALGSVEYIFPFTASEMVRGVAFTDFGTVEKTVAFHDFRASAGVGVRVTIPAMGPLPIALDLAWPLVRQDDDLTRIFSFYVGFLR